MTSTIEADSVEILRQDAKGRVRTPPEKREAILDEFERSGMSGAGFARHHGISYQTFALWRRKRSARRQPAEAPDRQPAMELEGGLALAEIVLPGSARTVEAIGNRGESGLRVELPGGAWLILTGVRQAPLAAALIHALQNPALKPRP